MNPEERDEVIQLYLDDIIPNRFQPREVFDERALKELAISIKEHGVIQPIIVRSVNGKYEIIAGERRYKASALAGLTKIPAIVRELDDKESSKVALLENLQRKNLNPIEEARTYQKILEIDQMTQEELAKTMGKSQSSIANKIRLLSLPDEIQNALLKEEISERHARSLLNVPTVEEQKELLNKIKETKMSVRVLEEEIKQKYAPVQEQQSIPENNSINPTIAIPEMVPSTNSYVNTQPLMPTAEMPIEDTSNYGKVTIAPPIGEEDTMKGKFLNFEEPQEENSNLTNKFINYGEIQEENPSNRIINYGEIQEENPSSSVVNYGETQEENPSDRIINYGEIHKEESKEQEMEAMEALNLSPGSTSVDINELTEKATDIPTRKKGSADLDNLLNLGNPNKQEQTDNAISTPDKINNIENETQETNKSNDYFQISELSQDNPFADTSIVSMNNPAITNLASVDTGEIYSLEKAQEKIREIVQELKEHGIKISNNEMDFEKSYQVIIKIDKE